jgi:hypothetical protein
LERGKLHFRKICLGFYQSETELNIHYLEVNCFICTAVFDVYFGRLIIVAFFGGIEKVPPDSG